MDRHERSRSGRLPHARGEAHLPDRPHRVPGARGRSDGQDPDAAPHLLQGGRGLLREIHGADVVSHG